MLATLAGWSALLWSSRRLHRRRGVGPWTKARLPQVFLGDDPVFRPLRNTVLLIAIVGTALALMPPTESPRFFDGVTAIANLLGFLCACNLVEAWLRARVLPKEVTR